MSGQSDQAVVEQVIKGDLDAFSTLVARYQDRVYSAVLNYVSNPDDAVDITQEAFVKAYTNLKRFKAGSAFYTWLYRIAINASIDFLRKRKSRNVDSLDDDRYAESGFEPVSKDPSTDPEKVVTRSLQKNALRGAVGMLSEKLRAVVVLHDIEGLSQDEVAEILNIPVGTVKSRVSRARVELRSILQNQVGEIL